MILRGDIIKILQSKAGKSQQEKRFAVEEYVNANVLTEEDKKKVLDDLDSYEDYK